MEKDEGGLLAKGCGLLALGIGALVLAAYFFFSGVDPTYQYISVGVFVLSMSLLGRFGGRPKDK